MFFATLERTNNLGKQVKRSHQLKPWHGYKKVCKMRSTEHLCKEIQLDPLNSWWVKLFTLRLGIRTICITVIISAIPYPKEKKRVRSSVDIPQTVK